MAYLFPFGAAMWSTYKGLEQSINGDAGGLIISNDYVVAVLVDEMAPDKTRHSLAQHWVQAVALTIQRLGSQLNPDSLVRGLKEEQSLLRSSGFLHQRAVYAILVLKREGFIGWALHCGDCRVGSPGTDHEMYWHTNVHTMANALGEPFTQEHARKQTRHVVTRSLNARRFVLPELTVLHERCERWFLATDGYWADHLISGIPFEELPDDASLLYLASSEIKDSTMGGKHNFSVWRF